MEPSTLFTREGERIGRSAGRVDSCKMVQIIRLEVIRGLGIDGDPIRRVIQWWEPEGKMIAEHDTWIKSQPQGEGL